MSAVTLTGGAARPLRIGIMLRTLQEKGGIGVYSENITRELLDLRRGHEFVLLYSDERHVGRFGERSGVTERVLRAPGKALWDQLAVPLACVRDRIDVLFHPKFTVPFAAPCPSVMVLHGAGWFMPEHARFWGRADRAYLRVAMPLYCRRAGVVLAVSNITRTTFADVLGIPEGKIRTVYFAPARLFRRVHDAERIASVREKYALPEKFVLTLSGWTKGPRKNIGTILEAYRAVHGSVPHALVVAGKDCDRFREAHDIPGTGWGADVHFPGWVDQVDLPVFYTLADAFLYPSFVEAFPVPITESLACGVPIVTSDANGTADGSCRWRRE